MRWIVLAVAFLVGCGGSAFTEADPVPSGEDAPSAVSADTASPEAGQGSDDGQTVDAAPWPDVDTDAATGSSSGGSSSSCPAPPPT